MSKKLRNLILGEDARQRRQIRFFLLTSVMYVACGMLTVYAAAIGVWEPWRSHVMLAYTAIGHVASYAFIRSRHSRRIPNTSLLLSQIVFAVSATDLAYAMGGEARAALIVIFAMHLMFTMLILQPRQTFQIGMGTMLSLLLTSAAMAWLEPARFPWRMELLHMGIAMGILPVMLVVAIRVARMRGQLEEMAQRDALTGLFNRRHMGTLMEDAISVKDPARGRLTIALLDIDHFKRINDTLGHQAGDAVLRHFARVLQQNVRGADVPARWGGEEFLLLFPDTPGTNALAALERVRSQLLAATPREGEPDVRATFSAGVAQRLPGESLDKLLERADHALYAAKEQGRNRSLVADAPTPPVAPRQPAAEDSAATVAAEAAFSAARR
ncbi:MAG: GGDEF domain-containing protein [Aquabacterium sp.]|nr:MAG: GGDEF domain-containing protein [Aquabacterium sp.]